ncbi:hypothetical protein TH66_12570 [Carbonactinospora thermoautotrophica]|uniref:Putative signal transduction histidine kinase n=2 Tax=Carbonactinospora thermoautotrophica TaxID=1469144 RepID=A0A132MYZ3_9ACTN|nr:ATP-binding protein [Carbonactinospora thermoautotrophica]KWX02572.1 putative signal transduction histidine kinase [Carbonactinospora thermoautotrophica]KWX03658.1 hypothetical protein TH66_12570 [Carbonactinospora thermoautotrophica]
MATSSNAPPSAAPPVGPPRPPDRPAPRKLYRSAQGRLLGGVARGLALHLGVDPLLVRIVFVLLAFTGLAGVVLYAAFWIVVPLGKEPDAVAPRTPQPRIVWPLIGIAAGMLMLTQTAGFGVSWLTWPLVVVGGGVAILWQQIDDSTVGGTRRWLGLTRTVGGVALILVGAALLIASEGAWDVAKNALLGAAVTVVGLALVSSPYWLRLLRELDAERRERIRSQERAELAAHVHDSVLHTLALIQRHAQDPKEVLRLARAQERALRTWLYRPDSAADQTLAAAVEDLAARIEEAHGVSIEVVCVGDCALDARLGAQLQAAREAMVNAAKYAGSAPISVYAEVEPDQVAIFVRDRGPGFDPDSVPEDRLGVRESIIGRMRRNGGTARIRSTPGEGTEVQLEMTRSTSG